MFLGRLYASFWGIFISSSLSHFYLPRPRVLLSLMLKSLFSRTFTMMGLILVQISFIQIETQLHVSFFLFLTILKIILYIVPIHDLFGLDNMDVLTI